MTKEVTVVDMARTENVLSQWRRSGPLTPSTPSGFALPAQGVSVEDVLSIVQDCILPGSVNVYDPDVIGQMNSTPHPMSVLGQYLMAATGQCLDSSDGGPVAARLEDDLIQELAGRVGYDKQDPSSETASPSGVFTFGGTQNNIMGVSAALHNAVRAKHGFSVKDEGIPRHLQGHLRIVCGEHAHYSIQRAAALVGLGRRSVLPVGTDEQLAMDPDRLDAALRHAVEQGDEPFLVVSTAGTTAAGSIPDMREIARVARLHGVYHHIDASYGGSLIFSEKHRHLLDGIEESDSIGIDFHKMGMQAPPSSVFLTSSRSYLSPFDFRASYLASEQEDLDMVVRGINTTKPFMGLPLYLTMLSEGTDGMAAYIDGRMDMAQKAQEAIDAHDRFEMAVPRQTNILLFSYRGVSKQHSNEANRRIKSELYNTGRGVLTTTDAHGRTLLRTVLMNPNTTIDSFCELIEDAADIGDNVRV